MRWLLSIWFVGLGLGFWLLPVRSSAVDADVCAICGGPFVDVYYSVEDKVTLEKKHICKECERSYPTCFVCGLPANTNSTGFLRLPDQRVLCARDGKTAVLREDDGVRICRDVRDELDRLFSRFTCFPETNVTVAVMDRVNLQALFNLLGNDYQCPNVWGMTDTATNHGRLQYRISLMTGLPLSWFQATCAHEYGHCWVSEHVTNARKAKLDRDAEEGFCELMSFLYMDSLNEEAQKALILRNAYTRGQIDLFVAAERTYGINEILDWMQFGTDGRLSAADPERIRKVSQQRSTAQPVYTLTAQRALIAEPDSLVLKAIIWDKKHPLAIINNQTFGPEDQAKVHLGGSNVVVRCLSISPDAVRLRVADSSQEQTLRLKSR